MELVRQSCKKIELYKVAEQESIDTLQLNAIMGSLMGDGALEGRNGQYTARIRWNHSWKQHEYVSHKYKLLQEHARCEPQKKENPGFGDYWSVLHLTAKRTYHLLCAMMYPDPKGPKRITWEFLYSITHPIALAWWFMDDGSRPTGQNSGASISTNGFVLEDVDRLRIWLKEEWDVDSTVITVKHSSTGKTARILSLTVRGYLRLVDLIKPYVPESMKYKIDLATRPCAVCGELIIQGRHQCCSPQCAEIRRQTMHQMYLDRTRDYRREKSRQYKVAHRDRINALARASYAALSAEKKAELNRYSTEWKRKNAERLNEKRRQWRLEHRDDPEYKLQRKLECARHYQAVKADPERYAHRRELANAAAREQWKNDPAKAEKQRKYRAKINADPVLRQQKLERDRLAEQRRLAKLTPEELAVKKARDAAAKREQYRKRMEAIKADPVRYAEHLKKSRAYQNARNARFRAMKSC
jgi:hypothetical protein